MASKRGLDTTLFRPKDTIEQEASQSPPDMTPEEEFRPIKRASFDIYADQLERLGILKYKRRGKISDMVKEALDEYLAKYEA